MYRKWLGALVIVVAVLFIWARLDWGLDSETWRPVSVVVDGTELPSSGYLTGRDGFTVSADKLTAAQTAVWRGWIVPSFWSHLMASGSW